MSVFWNLEDSKAETAAVVWIVMSDRKAATIQPLVTTAVCRMPPHGHLANTSDLVKWQAGLGATVSDLPVLLKRYQEYGLKQVRSTELNSVNL